MSQKAPLNDTIITVISRMVDDAQRTREPSHSDLEFHISRIGLSAADPKTQGQIVGKAKRIRAILSWALNQDSVKGEELVHTLFSLIRGCGGFRATSPNYIGAEVIQDAIKAFREEGFVLTSDGELHAALLDSLSSRETTAALRRYSDRAQRAVEDAALLAGTGKDLLEATAAHVLVEKWGSYSASANFPTLLGQAFVALGLKTPEDHPRDGEPYNCRLERSLYESACAINTMRNKEGTGHGRPWLPTVSTVQAKRATQLMGIISELLLDKLEGK